MSRRSTLAAAVAIVLAVSLGACSDDDAKASEPDTTVATAVTTTPTTVGPTTTTAPGPEVLDIVATEYKFDVPSTLTPGTREIHFSNAGAEAHELVLARLNDGVTIDEALAAEDPSTVVTGMQSTQAAPGGHAELTAELTAGTWVVACFLPAPDGAPHVAHGMLSTITVA